MSQTKGFISVLVSLCPKNLFLEIASSGKLQFQRLVVGQRLYITKCMRVLVFSLCTSPHCMFTDFLNFHPSPPLPRQTSFSSQKQIDWKQKHSVYQLTFTHAQYYIYFLAFSFSERKDSCAPSTEAHLKLPPLCLPPTPTWDVFITSIETTNTIHLLLVGEEYSVSVRGVGCDLFLYKAALMIHKQYILVMEKLGRCY